jgi:hypothetical protein
MNIFVLSNDTNAAAQMHLDKHAVRMPLEYAQMLSSAHRLLDGDLVEATKPNGKMQRVYLLDAEKLVLDNKKQKFVVDKPICYGTTHANHPCTAWARASIENYNWLFSLFRDTSAEYARRYGRQHKTWIELGAFLATPPKNIPRGCQTPFAQAMPEEYKNEDAVEAYRNFYAGSKARFARWTNSPVPSWFVHRLEGQDVSVFSRTR